MLLQWSSSLYSCYRPVLHLLQFVDSFWINIDTGWSLRQHLAVECQLNLTIPDYFNCLSEYTLGIARKSHALICFAAGIPMHWFALLHCCVHKLQYHMRLFSEMSFLKESLVYFLKDKNCYWHTAHSNRQWPMAL